MYSIKILKYTEYRYSSITFGWYMLCGNDVIMHVIMLLYLAWENTRHLLQCSLLSAINILKSNTNNIPLSVFQKTTTNIQPPLSCDMDS